MKPIGVTRFLGTNCDQDVFKALGESGHKPQWLWYSDHFDPSSVSAIVVPGGFSHGDYLRAGALAARQPVMDSVREAAKLGIPILGICNGMQILCEAGLIPGAMVRNSCLRFVDDWVELKLEQGGTVWDQAWPAQKTLRLPVAHGEGRFYIDADQLPRLYDEGQVWLRYEGEAPNGSLDNIAGVRSGSVAALMPHPERAMHSWMGGVDGRSFFAGHFGGSPR